LRLWLVDCPSHSETPRCLWGGAWDAFRAAMELVARPTWGVSLQWRGRSCRMLPPWRRQTGFRRRSCVARRGRSPFGCDSTRSVPGSRFARRRACGRPCPPQPLRRLTKSWRPRKNATSRLCSLSFRSVLRIRRNDRRSPGGDRRGRWQGRSRCARRGPGGRLNGFRRGGRRSSPFGSPGAKAWRSRPSGRRC